MYTHTFKLHKFLYRRTASFIKRMLSNILYCLFCKCIKQSKIVLYTSLDNNNFGNIYFISEKLNHLNVDHILLNKNNILTHPIHFFKQIASAKVLVIDSGAPADRINICKETCVINCWHAGGSYKKIGFASKIKNASVNKGIERVGKSTSYFVCTSEYNAQIYANAYNLPIESMLVFGMPRMDRCLKHTNETTKNVFTILYAPTFRKYKTPFRHFPNALDLNMLEKKLHEVFGKDICLAIRKHPTVDFPKTATWEDWSNIPQDEALSRASILITDYSSVFFDFLPYKRPVVFYVPDIEDYQNYERELYFSPYAEFPETTCGDMESLVGILQQCQNKSVDYSNFWNKHMSACDGHSTERLCSFILEKIKGSTI